MSILSGIIFGSGGSGGGGLARYANLAAFPPDGDLSIIYLAEDTNVFYIWAGSAYEEVINSDKTWDGEVANFAALPPVASHAGKVYMVLAPSGVRFINYKSAGIYISDGVNWNPSSFLAGTLTTSDVKNTLLDNSIDKPLSANQGNKLNITKQPINEDLTSIANLNPSQTELLQYTALGWINRSISYIMNSFGFGGILGFKDEDDMASDSPVDFATQQSIKAYSDARSIENLADTTIASVANKNLLNYDSGAAKWVNITPSALKTDLALVKGDVGLNNVQNVDQTNASNITSGTLNVSRLPTAGINASQVAAALDTTDTTCFPIFKNNATDDYAIPKYNVNFKYNSSTNTLEASNVNLTGGLNVGYTTGSTTPKRISLGDNLYYIDRGNINLPLVNFDSDDYIGYNRSSNYWAWVIGGSEVSRIDAAGYKLSGNQAISIGGDNTDTPPSTPLAQLYLGGLDNSGFNNSTKLWVDGYDNETPRDVVKFTDENGKNDFNVRSGVNYPILTSRGQTIFSEADRTAYTVNLNTMTTAGIYMIGSSSTNLPPMRDVNESSYVLVVYTWGPASQNGVQTLYCTDRDGTNDFVAMYNRTWEGVSWWTSWNCFSSERVVLADLNVSIGAGYTNFTVNKNFAYITNTYKQLVYMITTSTHNSTMVLDAPTLALNAVYEIGKYSTRYVNIKTPTSTTSTTWQAYGGSVTITNIKLIAYR